MSFFLLTITGMAFPAQSAGTGKPDVIGVHVSVLGTRRAPLEGFEFSLLGAIPTADSGGLQIAGVFNFHKGSFSGLQLSGVLNHTRGTVVGMQAGPVNSSGRLLGFGLGFVNAADQLTGLQAGFLNVSLSARGVQAGAINHAETLVGLQAGAINLAFRFFGAQVGFVNVQANPTLSPQGVPSLENGAGLQVGIFNYAVDADVGQVGYFNWAQTRGGLLAPPARAGARTAKTSWLQLGFINLSDTDSCLQIGVINVTHRARCATIGLFNFIRNGSFSATLWREPMGGTNFGFRFAGEHFYYLFGAGNANPVYGCEGQNSLHLHFGGQVPLRDRWSLEADLGWSHFNAFERETTRRAPAPGGIPDLDRLALRVMVRFRLFEFFSLYAGLGPGWIWDHAGLSSGGFVPVILGGVSADLPGSVW